MAVWAQESQILEAVIIADAIKMIQLLSIEAARKREGGGAAEPTEREPHEPERPAAKATRARKPARSRTKAA